MLLPIGDDNSGRHITPYVTYALIALNVLVFVLLQVPNDIFTSSFSVVPQEITQNKDLVGPVSVGGNQYIQMGRGPNPIQLTILTAMFMHGGWAHLFGNMLYLWIFGDNVEDALGHIKFLMFYLLCGVLATFAHIFAEVNSVIPSLGASGAIAGVLGGYLVLFPSKRIKVLIGWMGIIEMPAIVVIGIWIALQVFGGFGSLGREGGGVAFWAHVGGAVAGLVLVWLFRSRLVVERAQARMAAPANPADPFFDESRHR